MGAPDDWGRFDHVHRRLWAWYYVHAPLVVLGPFVVSVLPPGLFAEVVHVLVGLTLIATVLAMPYYAYHVRRQLGSRLALGWAVLMVMPVLNSMVMSAIEQDVVKARAAEEGDDRPSR